MHGADSVATTGYIQFMPFASSTFLRKKKKKKKEKKEHYVRRGNVFQRQRKCRSKVIWELVKSMLLINFKLISISYVFFVFFFLSFFCIIERKLIKIQSHGPRVRYHYIMEGPNNNTVTSHLVQSLRLHVLLPSESLCEENTNPLNDTFFKRQIKTTVCFYINCNKVSRDFSFRINEFVYSINKCLPCICETKIDIR